MKIKRRFTGKKLAGKYSEYELRQMRCGASEEGHLYTIASTSARYDKDTDMFSIGCRCVNCGNFCETMIPGACFFLATRADGGKLEGVRCKDCKHYQVYDDYPFPSLLGKRTGTCKKYLVHVEKEDFCFFGTDKRRTTEL